MKRERSDSPERLLEQMGRMAVPVLSSDREAQLLLRTTATVEHTLDQLARKPSFFRAHGRTFAAVAAAVAVLSLSAGWLLSGGGSSSAPVTPHLLASNGEVIVVKGGASIPASSGAALLRGDEVVTAAGAHANLALADLAAVEVGSETRVRVAEPPSGHAKNERIDLVQGEISFRVPKLEAGSTLSVQTPDALVTVRGTRFTVNVERSDQTVVTRVSVLEGRVEVESRGRTLSLARGERWSSATTKQSEERALGTVEAAPAPSSEASGQKRIATGPNDDEAMAPKARSSAPSASDRPERRPGEPSSTLAEENALYQSALRANQNGDAAGSLSTLESLVRKYPRSPLVQNARVEHFRVLLQMGNVAAAAREARRYLSEYPSGFARAEARQIALRGLGDAD